MAKAGKSPKCPTSGRRIGALQPSRGSSGHTVTPHTVEGTQEESQPESSADYLQQEPLAGYEGSHL